MHQLLFFCYYYFLFWIFFSFSFNFVASHSAHHFIDSHAIIIHIIYSNSYYRYSVHLLLCGLVLPYVLPLGSFHYSLLSSCCECHKTTQEDYCDFI